MVRDCLAMSFPHVVVGVLLHMRTCMPRFYIPVTTRPIVFKLSVPLGTAWVTTALPCIFRNAGATRLGPGERCEMLFWSVWNRAYLPGTSNRPLPPPALPRAWFQRVGTLRGREPWRRAGRACHPSCRQPVAWAGELLARRADRPTL